MLRIRRLDSSVAAMAEHGLLFGHASPWAAEPGVEPGSVAEAMPSVRDFVAAPVLPQEDAQFKDLAGADVALALVAGARRAALDARAIELAAAQVAREHGVTVRQLAQAAGISERAANDRYRKSSSTSD